MNAPDHVAAVPDLASIERDIRAALEDVRPWLQQDNGDVEFVAVTADGIVEVRFLGECATCSLSIMTLRAGIERYVLNAVPGLRRMEMV